MQRIPTFKEFEAAKDDKIRDLIRRSYRTVLDRNPTNEEERTEEERIYRTVFGGEPHDE